MHIWLRAFELSYQPLGDSYLSKWILKMSLGYGKQRATAPQALQVGDVDEKDNARLVDLSNLIQYLFPTRKLLRIVYRHNHIKYSLKFDTNII